jgi:hypothetical protein
VVDLSSNEEDVFPDTSRDEDFARRLFDDLKRGLLGPHRDDKVIIISDSDEEEEAHREDVADADATLPSVVKSLAPITPATDADDTAKGALNDSNDNRSPDRAIGDSSSGGDEASSP